jgi:hypothetical protein
MIVTRIGRLEAVLGSDDGRARPKTAFVRYDSAHGKPDVSMIDADVVLVLPYNWRGPPELNELLKRHRAIVTFDGYGPRPLKDWHRDSG